MNFFHQPNEELGGNCSQIHPGSRMVPAAGKTPSRTKPSLPRGISLPQNHNASLIHLHMSRTDSTKTVHLVIEYLQGHPVPVKLTILYSHRDSITLVLEFAEGPYWNTKWKFQTDKFGLPGVIHEDLLDLITDSDAVELSTVFVTSGSLDASNWKKPLQESVKSFDADRNVIRELPQEPDFDIVFGLKRNRNRQSVTLVFQPESETPSHSTSSWQRQNAYLQEQLEQNRNEIAALREQLRSHGGVDMQRQVIHTEALMEKKLKEVSDSTSRALQGVSEKHDQHVKDLLEQLKSDQQTQLARLKADHQKQLLQMQSQIQSLQSQMPPQEKVVTFSEPKLLARSTGTFTLDPGVVPRNAKKVTLLLYIEKGAQGSDQGIFVKAHTTIGSQKHYHHLFVHQYSNPAWVFDNVEWEFPIEPNHRQVVLETDRVLHGNHSIVLYVVGYTV